MKKTLQKNVYWVGAIAAYAMLIAAFAYVLFDLGRSELPRLTNEALKLSSGEEWARLASAGQYSGVLLPKGPDEERLPGFAVIWNAFLRAGDADFAGTDSNGFDGLQAVTEVADLSKGSVVELFISGLPKQVFRRGTFLLVLNGNGKVQIIDCQDPRTPKISGALPYQSVTRMEMQGDIAWMHLSSPRMQHDSLVVADLGDPLKPRQLTQVNLQDRVEYFSLYGRQLIIYTTAQKGYIGESFVSRYDVLDDFQLVLLNRAKRSKLGSSFFKYGNYLLNSDSQAGVNVFDLSDPLPTVPVASLALPAQIKNFSRHGEVVFALGDNQRIYAIDLHDPLHPGLLTVVEEANHAVTFMTFDNYTYYFTSNGYLRVFDSLPSVDADGGGQRSTRMVGELVPASGGEGFTLLGNSQGALPAAVREILTLPDETQVTDNLLWQDFVVVLDDDGLVQFFRKAQATSLQLQGSLKLPPAQRWLAASDKRLYVGGESSISVITRDDAGQFVLSGQVEFAGEESWDGLVVQQTLCVAAGKQGVVCFSVEDPDHLTASPRWTPPRHLETQVDVRQLATPGGDRILAAAGSAGLLSGRIDNAGQFQPVGLFNFAAPLYALAVIGDFCLVSTGIDISVIDIRTPDSLQNLGRIGYPGVTKLAVAAPDFWAGYVPGAGWSIMPAPRLVSPEEQGFHRSAILAEPSGEQYRLNLFNDHEVITVSGWVTLPSLSDSRSAGATRGLQ